MGVSKTLFPRRKRSSRLFFVEYLYYCQKKMLFARCEAAQCTRFPTTASFSCGLFRGFFLSPRQKSIVQTTHLSYHHHARHQEAYSNVAADSVEAEAPLCSKRHRDDSMDGSSRRRCDAEHQVRGLYAVLQGHKRLEALPGKNMLSMSPTTGGYVPISKKKSSGRCYLEHTERNGVFLLSWSGLLD